MSMWRGGWRLNTWTSNEWQIINRVEVLDLIHMLGWSSRENPPPFRVLHQLQLQSQLQQHERLHSTVHRAQPFHAWLTLIPGHTSSILRLSHTYHRWWTTMSNVPFELSQYGLQDLYTAKRTINEARYAIIAMLCLQIYEWVAGCVVSSLWITASKLTACVGCRNPLIQNKWGGQARESRSFSSPLGSSP